MSQRLIALAVTALVLVTLPYWMGGIYYINVASQILFYAVFALGLNVLAGYGGLVSLGHAALFGISAYAAGYILQAGYRASCRDHRRASCRRGVDGDCLPCCRCARPASASS